jgi:hypothetical protein
MLVLNEKEKYPEKYLVGTVFEIYGSHIAGGKSGNHYEVAARDVIFQDWSRGKELVLGEWIFCLDAKGVDLGYYTRHPEERVMGHFYTILEHHQRWGIFVPRDPETQKYIDIDTIERTLAWHRRDGEQPKVEDDDPGTFFYRTLVENGVEIDALERVRVTDQKTSN